MYKLRDYQQKASDAAVSFFNNRAKKTNAIMVLPTGSGKSLIIADIAVRLDGHTLVFQPSKEILEQNFKKLCSYGILDCSTPTGPVYGHRTTAPHDAVIIVQGFRLRLCS